MPNTHQEILPLHTAFDQESHVTTYSVVNPERGITAKADVKGTLLYYEGETVQSELTRLVNMAAEHLDNVFPGDKQSYQQKHTGETEVNVSLEFPMNKNVITNSTTINAALYKVATKLSGISIPPP